MVHWSFNMLKEHWNGFLRALMDPKCPQWSICPYLALWVPCGLCNHRLTSFSPKMSPVAQWLRLAIRGACVCLSMPIVESDQFVHSGGNVFFNTQHNGAGWNHRFFFFFTYFRSMVLRVSWLQWSHWSCWLARLCWSPQLVVNGNRSESGWAGVLSPPSWCCLACSPSALSSLLLRSCFSVVCWKFHWASSSCASSCSAKHNEQLIWVFLDVRIYILYTKKKSIYIYIIFFQNKLGSCHIVDFKDFTKQFPLF